MPSLTRAGYMPPRKQRPEEKPEPPKKKKKRRKKRMNGAAAASLVVLLIAVLIGVATVYVYTCTQPYAEAFLPGTALLGEPLGGLSYAQGEQTLSELTGEAIADWSFTITGKTQSWTLTAQDVALHADAEKTLGALWQAGREGGMVSRFLAMLRLREEPMIATPVLAYSMDAADALLEEICAQVECEPVNATVAFAPGNSEPFRYTDEKDGWALDTAPLREAVEASILSLEPGEEKTGETRLAPSVTRAQLEAASCLRSRVVMTVSVEPASVANMQKAAALLSGARIDAGGTLSFNAVVGARTAESGYVEAEEPAYGAGAVGLGGGLCQLSTALYRAALLGDLPVEERHAAVSPVSYCEIGQEAAVSDQGLDLVLGNPTDSPVFVSARIYADGDAAVCEVQLFGEPLSVRYVLNTQAEETEIPTEPVYVRDRAGRYATYTDERVPVGEGGPGYTAVVERVTLDALGNELERETVSTDSYDPIAPTVYVGVTER